MNTYWSQYVQKTEELYLSRALKFHRGNMDKWVDAMQLREEMKILEVGCAGGLLCHRLKSVFQMRKLQVWILTPVILILLKGKRKN